LVQLGLLKTAIRHKWLTTLGGAERLLERIIEAFIGSAGFPIYHSGNERHFHLYHKQQPQTSFVQYRAFARRHSRFYPPLMSSVIVQLYLSASDIILSSSHARINVRKRRKGLSSQQVEHFSGIADEISRESCSQNVGRFSNAEFRKGLAAISSTGVDADAFGECFSSIFD
jgi:hypothetical protein